MSGRKRLSVQFALLFCITAAAAMLEDIGDSVVNR